MPLKDRKRKKRLIRGGIIRLGHKEKTKSGFERPVQDDHFLLHDAPAILESYGEEQDGKVRVIDVTLPFPDVERNFDANYNIWAGGVLICKGDGEYIEHASPFVVKDKFDKEGEKSGISVRNAPGETLVDNGVAQTAFSWNGEEFAPGSLVPCSGETKDLYPHCAACKMTAILKLMMIRPELVRMAYYQLATGSGRNHDVIVGTLDELYANFGQVNGIRYWLRLVEQGTSYKDESGIRRSTKKWFLQLEPYPEDVQRMYDKQRARLFGVAQIAPPTDTVIDVDAEYVADDAAPPPFAEEGGPAESGEDETVVEGTIVEKSSPKKPTPPKQNGRTLKELMALWSERWNEAKALGLDVEPLTGKSTKAKILERGKVLAARIEQAKAEKAKAPLKWPTKTIQAITSLKTVDNSYQAMGRLNKSDLSPSDPLDVVVTWMEKYDESKADDGGPDDPAAMANAWLKSQIEPEAE